MKSASQRRVKEYRLTASGTRHLAVEQTAWRSYARAVDLILRAE